ncbi:hypothetical protein FHG87_001497 [Trinorchestia longiramus]|nr:hypothetical protein FHG87_001497 [Trinorchestia longiramus]
MPFHLLSLDAASWSRQRSLSPLKCSLFPWLLPSLAREREKERRREREKERRSEREKERRSEREKERRREREKERRRERENERKRERKKERRRERGEREGEREREKKREKKRKRERKREREKGKREREREREKREREDSFPALLQVPSPAPSSQPCSKFPALLQVPSPAPSSQPCSKFLALLQVPRPAPSSQACSKSQPCSNIFNATASCLPSPKPASRPAKVEDQQLRYFLQMDKITSFDAFKPERYLQKQYKNLIISRWKGRLVCLFMTDYFTHTSAYVDTEKEKLVVLTRQLELLSQKQFSMKDYSFALELYPKCNYEQLRDFVVLPCKRNLQYITSSIDKDQVLRETFDKVQTLQQKNVFLLVDEVQIRPTVSFSGNRNKRVNGIERSPSKKCIKNWYWNLEKLGQQQTDNVVAGHGPYELGLQFSLLQRVLLIGPKRQLGDVQFK